MDPSAIPALHGPLLAQGAPDAKHALRLAAHLWRHPRARFLTLNAERTDFLLIRSYGGGNALARLQSDPLIAGLAEHGQTTATHAYHPAQRLTLPRAKTLIIHYDDDASIIRARAYRAETGARVICLTSDIYGFARYRFLDPLVDAFVAPTEMHRAVLQSAVRAPVFVMPEGVDPIAHAPAPPTGADLCWFGYPASFEKSLAHVFNEAESQNAITPANFAFITRKGVTLRKGYPHIAFVNATFHAETARFGHTLLSHFAYDGHLNTLIKSPNKLVTSLVRGLIPLVSDTPAYREIMSRYGLEQLIFTGPRHAADLIAARDAPRDRRLYDLPAIAADLCDQLRPAALAQIFLDGLAASMDRPIATRSPA